MANPFLSIRPLNDFDKAVLEAWVSEQGQPLVLQNIEKEKNRLFSSLTVQEFSGFSTGEECKYGSLEGRYRRLLLFKEYVTSLE